MSGDVPGEPLAVGWNNTHFVAVGVLGTSREVYAVDCGGQVEVVHLCPSLQVRADHLLTPDIVESRSTERFAHDLICSFSTA